MQPLPTKIDCADESLDEARLEGSFNLKTDDETRRAFARELFRVLRPGGTVQVHALVCDRPLTVKPMLPGPAALVEYVPLEHEALDLLTSVGFVEGRYTVLGESPCFDMAGAELREMKLVVAKPKTASDTGMHRVIYKGPLAQVVDDSGTVYPRGRRVEIDSIAWENLQRGSAAEQFVFLQCSSKSGGCGK
jgi:arsenite methyltransferase